MNKRMELQFEVEQLYAREAHLLDDREFEAWLELFTDDLVYKMPMAQNVAFGDIDNEYIEDGLALHWMDEDKETLAKRVQQIRTGVHWAEEPLSRTAHLVSNVLIDTVVPDLEDPRELTVRCHIHSYRHRLNDQENTIVGRRRDTLRRVDGQWRIAARTVYISQTVYLGSSFSHFV